MAVKLLLLLVAASVGSAQEQPVAFSHKQHAGDLKLKCTECHINPDPGEAMTLPAPAVCGKCHPGKYDREMKWVRIYELPSFVSFSHRAHLTAGNQCEACHGPVNQRVAMKREMDLSMAACMNCHREKKASVDCTYCHDQQN